MNDDNELKAMSDVVAALKPLDSDARSRVLNYAASRYRADGAIGQADSKIHPDNFNDFAGLFTAASPKSEVEKALVGGYWLQVGLGQPSFTGQQLNGILNDLGSRVKNITDALGSLQKKKPALVIQVSKSGKSQQARKTYRLTQPGMNTVNNQLTKLGED